MRGGYGLEPCSSAVFSPGTNRAPTAVCVRAYTAPLPLSAGLVRAGAGRCLPGVTPAVEDRWQPMNNTKRVLAALALAGAALSVATSAHAADPAPVTGRLTSNDALLVEAVHTDINRFGTNIISGDHDFFPNGGM